MHNIFHTMIQSLGYRLYVNYLLPPLVIILTVIMFISELIMFDCVTFLVVNDYNLIMVCLRLVKRVVKKVGDSIIPL